MINLMANNNLSLAKIKKTLCVGQIFPNYTKLCEALNQKPTGGRSKELQIQNWQRYFEFDREGYKFTITKIFDKPLPKIDKQEEGNNSIYVDYIMYLLMIYFSKQEGYTATFYKTGLYKILGITNKNYTENLPNNEKKKIISKYDSVNRYDIDDFFNRTPPKLEKILFTALNNLKRRCLLDYFREYVILEPVNNRGLTEYTSRTATKSEVKEILDIRHSVLEEMEVKTIWQVRTQNKLDDFYARVNEIQFERHGWYRVFVQYKIVFSKENIIKDIDSVKEDIQRKLLNESVCDSLNRQAEYRFQKNYVDLDLYELFAKDNEKLTNEDRNKLMSNKYLLAQSQLTNLFIKLSPSELIQNNYNNNIDEPDDI